MLLVRPTVYRHRAWYRRVVARLWNNADCSWLGTILILLTTAHRPIVRIQSNLSNIDSRDWVLLIYPLAFFEALLSRLVLMLLHVDILSVVCMNMQRYLNFARLMLDRVALPVVCVLRVTSVTSRWYQVTPTTCIISHRIGVMSSDRHSCTLLLMLSLSSSMPLAMMSLIGLLATRRFTSSRFDSIAHLTCKILFIFWVIPFN